MIESGGNFLLEVKQGSTWYPVSEMHTFSRDTRRNISNFPVFNRSTPHRFVGKKDETFSVEGYEDADDSGQQILLAAEAAGTEVDIRATRDGDNGFEQTVLVTSKRNGASAEDESIQSISFEFMATDEETIVS